MYTSLTFEARMQMLATLAAGIAASSPGFTQVEVARLAGSQLDLLILEDDYRCKSAMSRNTNHGAF